MNSDKKLLIPILAIIAIFALSLIFYFIFSAPYGDGLERTMEEAGVEGEPVFEAPLSYGDDYFTTFAMGLIGFLIIVGLVLLVGRILGRKDETHND
ncbi:MAG: cobalt transporter [Methanobacteriota archaeon]|nr:MAG: cobalt transporter [Euryarchaeota archaeon]